MLKKAKSEKPINAKSVTPAGQKKPLEFDGKRFQTYSINITSKGDIMINGQDFKVGKSIIGNSGSDGARLYQGVYLFQFDPQGNLKHNYGVQLDQKERAGFFSTFINATSAILNLHAVKMPSKKFNSSSGK
mgnify:CR=1 FL=1